MSGRKKTKYAKKQFRFTEAIFKFLQSKINATHYVERLIEKDTDFIRFKDSEKL
jgi:hypothetical protein